MPLGRGCVKDKRIFSALFDEETFERYAAPLGILKDDWFTATLHLTFTVGSTGNCGVGLLSFAKLWLNIDNKIGNFKEDAFRYLQQDFAGTNEGIKSHMQTAYFSGLLKGDERFRDIFCSLVKSSLEGGQHHCYFFTDSANRGRGRLGYVPELDFRTQQLGVSLFNYGFGYIVRSPISLNHAHMSNGDVSLAQNWIWYPPGAVFFKNFKYLGKGKAYKTTKEAIAQHKKVPGRPPMANETAVTEIMTAFEELTKDS